MGVEVLLIMLEWLCKKVEVFFMFVNMKIYFDLGINVNKKKIVVE